MPGEIKNFVRQGLPAKIYGLCYLEPHTGYELGKNIYKVERYPHTARIYGWTKRLTENGFLERRELKFVAKAGPLVEDLAKSLPFTLIDSQVFRSYMKIAMDSIPEIILQYSKKSSFGDLLICRMRDVLEGSSSYLLDVRKNIHAKDPFVIYDKMTNGRYESDFQYPKNITQLESFKIWADCVEHYTVRLGKELTIRFDGMRQLYDRNCATFENSLKEGHHGKVSKKEFTASYTKFCRVSLLLWLLPNDVLRPFAGVHESHYLKAKFSSAKRNLVDILPEGLLWAE